MHSTLPYRNLLTAASLCLLSLTVSQAQTAANTAASPVAAAASNTPAGATKLPEEASNLAPQLVASEVSLLREQVRVMKEYHSSLLDTVYWALGGAFGLLLFISGINWWSNFSIYDKDRQRLREEVMGMLKEFEAKSAASLTSSQAAVDQALDAKLEGFSARLSADMNQVRSAIDTVRPELEEKITWLQKQTTETTKQTLRLQAKVARTNAELRLVEEEVWDAQGTFSNILITQGQGLSAAVESGDESLVEIVLNRMKGTVQTKFINADRKLNPDIPKLVERRLLEAEDIKPIQVAEVRDLLSKVKLALPEAKSSDA